MRCALYFRLTLFAKSLFEHLGEWGYPAGLPPHPRTSGLDSGVRGEQEGRGEAAQSQGALGLAQEVVGSDGKGAVR